MPRARTISDAAILEACRSGFLEAGLNASTRFLAERAGVSEGVLFQRFHTKDELFFAAMRLPRPELEAVLRRALELRTPKKALLMLAETALDYLRASMPAALLVLAHPELRGAAGAASARSHDVLLDARSLFASFERVITHHDRGRRTTPRQRRALAEILISTLLARAIHEQIGIEDPVRGRDWLSDIVNVVAARITEQ